MKKRCKLFDVAAGMPPLRHKVGDEFSFATSEVATWLASQPEIRDYIMRRCSRGAKPLIVFDQATGRWQGRDYKPAAPRKWVF